MVVRDPKTIPVALALSIVILAIFVIYPASALYEKYNGLMVSWHKAKICMPCHINTLPEKQLNKFLYCTPCHSGKVNLKDPKSIEKIHTVDVCIKCHVGSKYSSRNLGLKVHVPHYKLKCSDCHGQKNISIPEAKVCSDCHGGNPHAVHGRILDQICTFCHSNRIYDFIKERPKEVEKIIKTTPTPTPAPKEVSFRSLSDLILWIVNLLF